MLLFLNLRRLVKLSQSSFLKHNLPKGEKESQEKVVFDLAPKGEK